MADSLYDYPDLPTRRGFSKLDPDFILPEYATYQDYLSWPEDVRAEVIDGVVYPLHIDEHGMAAAPLNDHQRLVLDCAIAARIALKGTDCRVFVAPFAVRLDEEDTRTVEPDLTVICDPTKLRERGCVGAPDWVVEVLSPTTVRHDQIRKRALYEAAGVGEYWVVDPAGRLIYRAVLDEAGRYPGVTIHAAPEVLSPRSFPQVKVDLADLFGVLKTP